MLGPAHSPIRFIIELGSNRSALFEAPITSLWARAAKQLCFEDLMLRIRPRCEWVRFRFQVFRRPEKRQDTQNTNVYTINPAVPVTCRF